LTRAFVVGLSFNIIANLLLIPRFSYVGAAAVTILSELVEGFVFMIYLERSLGSIRWLRLLWRLFAAAGAMFVLMGLAWAWHPIAGLIVGPVVYLGTLVALKAIGPEEKRVLNRLRGSRGAEENERIEEVTTPAI
jgi:O-antigen/teichoic acid export membrane protein